jgi:hypothetical protein
MVEVVVVDDVVIVRGVAAFAEGAKKLREFLLPFYIWTEL